jgi:membrane protease YdiL (CAAX protease family)
MAFGEEIVFRGYVQTRLVERYRAIWGILITALVFVLLHQISYSLSPILILSGVLLWTSVGVIYYLSESLYLVVIFHGLMNALINTLNLEFGDIGGLILHAFALSLVIVVAFVRSIGSGIRPNSI